MPAVPSQPTMAGILALALPALGVLAATPIFLLIDTAAVGQYGGAILLAALATGTTLYSIVTTQLTFLSYGTTARAARLFGAGDRAAAIAEGVQATWIALCVGSVLALIMWLGAPLFTLWIADDPQVATLATTWLRITSFGIPMVLLDMAGNGWLRGIQNTKLPLYFTVAGVIPGAILVVVLVHQFGILGSAWATLIGTAITAVCFLIALIRAHQGSWALDTAIIRSQLSMGKDLILRSLSFQIAMISAAVVAGRISPAALGAHQVLMQLQNFMSLILDSLAIAAQTLVGAALGAQSVTAARMIGQRVVLYSSVFALILAAGLSIGASYIPALFSTDPVLLAELARPWWQLVALVVLGGVVFAFDGVLLGASDSKFLRSITLLAVFGGFIPGVWLAYFLQTGLVGLWWGLLAFMAIRLVAVVYRFQSMKWATLK